MLALRPEGTQEVSASPTFDEGEWTFFPKDMEAWMQAAKAKPEENPISEYNAGQDLEYRRWRLQKNDTDSEASQDQHYVSAFTDTPIRKWAGEPGALIIRNQRKSTLYDESVPYSHREGYTFADYTANDSTIVWRMYRTRD
ncbi:hypothetical protein GP486_007879 [Trichoglossum hirsutum]|uniref:Uncharacterized protein n=1 Tax=Trichoglossum hirsutum TaxID=265104 RepID=A0A9P8IAX2_9PEZI|nr:hypothetical protein GP486_007879 [Trichoglossum hirsutum]